MDEKTINSFRVAQARAKALRSTGKYDDNYIVDSVMEIPGLSSEAKSTLKQAKVEGISQKAIDDILALPVDKTSVDVVTKEDVRGELKRNLGETVGGSIANVSEFLGIDKIGRAIGSTLGGGKVRELADQGQISQEDAMRFQKGGSTTSELVGSAALTAGQLLAPGLAGAATKTLGGIKGGAALGAGFGASGALESGARSLSDVGRGAAAGAALGAAIPAAGKALNYAAGRSNSKLLSIITGESTDVIDAALKNPKAADAALANGDEALRVAVQKGQEQSVQLRDSFNQAYRAGIKEIGKQVQAETGKTTITSRKDIQDALTKSFEQSNIRVGKNGLLDFSQSQVQADPGEMAAIQRAYEAVKGWKDFSFAGADDFKHLVGKLTKFSDSAGLPSKSPTLGRAYNNLNNLIKTSLPEKQAAEYAASNARYSKTIDLYDEMVDAFNKGDAFSKVANLFSKNKDTLRQVVDFYEKETGESISGTVAGRELSAERGGEFLGFLSPRAWFDFIFSPELQTKAITGLGYIEQGLNAPGRPLVNAVSNTARTLGKAAPAASAAKPRALQSFEAGAGALFGGTD